ncbi:Lcl domain-containing protein [Thiothrix subterranea]|uniref:DUF1566 domain-containing protein n=1 Tax=Thiothrix subterranea TaxID=2735563 RepID=A0AA51MMN7_9GAMM|nr:DUF1566 domain-containing protein [Thiothrix subterranea]MDQ5767808.1 DUF1566 domain-containing protein [Thiothrix subterranea]WML86730.1 DUF1566 domain-containing protein [Thiothrix subterranea]
MTGLKLGLGIIMVLLAGMACADEKNVRLVEAQQFAQGNKVAVIVGVNTYDQESGLRPLKYADADANALTTVLQKHGYAARTLTNQKATKSYILNAIKQAGETLNPQQGTLVFAFSGHGFAQGGNNYLASYGTVGGNLSESALSMQELEQAVRATKARRAVLFIDACRDNPGLEGSKSIGQPSFIQQQSEGIQVLYATKFGEISWEHDSLKHGVFSYFLQKALNGEAADTQGAISFDNLKSYVQQQVANWTFTNLARTQKPFSMGENYGIFMLAAGGNLPTAPTPTPKPEPVAAPSQPVIRPEPVPEQTAATNLISGHYIDNGDGTIIDTQTKLIWKKCSEGQSGDNCSGEPATYTWDEAMAKSGKGEWRLPTREELRTLVYCSNGTPQESAWDYVCDGKYDQAGEYQRPTIGLQAFPNTPIAVFWSSSPVAGHGYSAWIVEFGDGHDDRSHKDNAFPVRLVRSGQ